MAKDHQIFVTDAVVKAYDSDFDWIEKWARASAKALRVGNAVKHRIQYEDGKIIALITERHRGRIIVSIDDDPGDTVKCLECLKAGRIETDTTH